MSFKNMKDAKEFLETHSVSKYNNPLKRKRSYEKKNEFEPQEKIRKTSGKLVEIYTDGGCNSNGLNNAIAGVGVFFGENDSRNVSKRIEGLQTNNRAELTAIIEALKICLDYDSVVVIYTDSEYSINGICGANKIKKNKDLFLEITGLLQQRKGETKFEKVQGHSGKKDGNYFADLLASNAIKKSNT
jgi:ribonuclease HI